MSDLRYVYGTFLDEQYFIYNKTFRRKDFSHFNNPALDYNVHFI